MGEKKNDEKSSEPRRNAFLMLCYFVLSPSVSPFRQMHLLFFFFVLRMHCISCTTHTHTHTNCILFAHNVCHRRTSEISSFFFASTFFASRRYSQSSVDVILLQQMLLFFTMFRVCFVASHFSNWFSRLLSFIFSFVFLCVLLARNFSFSHYSRLAFVFVVYFLLSIVVLISHNVTNSISV